MFNDISLHDVRIFGSGKLTLEGYDAARPLGIQFDNVLLDSPQLIQMIAGHVHIAVGPGPANFTPSGEDVNISGRPRREVRGALNAFAEKFLPLPGK